MAKVEIRGLDKLQKKLKKNCTLVKLLAMQYLQKGIQQEQPKEVSEVKHVMADSHMQKGQQHIMHLMLNLEHVLWMHNHLLDLLLNNKCQYLSQI